jgi:LPS-assembly protein
MSIRAARLLVCSLCMLPAIGGAADAIPLDACPTSRDGLIRVQPSPSPARTPALEPTELRADSMRSLDPNEIELNGNAEAARDGQHIRADFLRYHSDQNQADAAGNVVVTEQDGSRFTTGELHLNLDTHVGGASAGSYRLFDRAGRGDMSRVEFLDQDHTRLFDVRYTTCPEGREAWFLQARQIDLDTGDDTGLARDATLRIFGVPVLYLPAFAFPISDRRKSGFLVPEIGYGSELGAVVAAPYYWNIAPNYDATLTPRWMTERGVQLQSEFRYLGQSLNGKIEAEYLPDDKKTGENRAAGTFIHNQTFNPYWSAAVNLRGVSDKDYLSDFGDHLSVTSETYLPENAEANYRGSAWTFTARATGYQTVDRTIAPINQPYARLPQLLLNGDSGPTTGGLQYRLESEFDNFDRDIGVVGKRANLSPSIQLPLTRPYGFLTPTVGARYIGYSLEQAPTPDNHPSVSAPFASLDTGLYFDRTLELGGGSFDQTLEPRLFYLYVPARPQDNLPNFDTSVPDFSFTNLFRSNRFIGGDRIGDANQYTAALTTRLVDEESGAERFSASIGRIHYFDARTVNLPPGTVGDASSDIAAEAVVWLPGNWYARTSLQWTPERDQAARQEFFLQYQPAADRILNVGYHFVRDSLDQSDISAEWPLGQHWTLRGRSLYSLRDNENVESVLGIEYRDCCWALRFYATRRLVQTPAGSGALTEQRAGVLLEFELSGLSGARSQFESPLRQGLFTFPTATAANP